MKPILTVLALAACAAPPPPTPAAAPATVVPTAAKPAPEAMTYPPTRRVEVKDTVHGVEIVDPYRWLEDAKTPEVQEWMKAQDAFARQRLNGLPGRDALAARFRELFYVEAVQAPVHRGNRYFFSRRPADKEKYIVYWREGKNGPEKVLFDPNTWTDDGSLTLGEWDVSWDGKNVAYQVHRNNSDENTIYVMDVATGKKSTIDVIEHQLETSAAWTPKGDGFYYTHWPSDPTIPVADRPGYADIRFHKLGTDPKTDRLVHDKTGDPSKFIGASLSRDGHWLIVSISNGWRSNDVYYRDTRARSNDWKPLVVGRDALFNVRAWKDRFYIHNNDGAPTWRVDVADPKHPEREHWKEVVADRKDATLEGIAILGGRLAVDWMKDVISHVEIRELDGKLVREVALPGLGTVGGPIGEEGDDEAYYSFSTFATPTEIYSMSIATGKTELYFRTKVPVDTTPYVTEQVFFKSKDGTRVPMFLVHRKDMPRDGSVPTLLYGYGGFQIAEKPYFTSSIFPWLEHGGMFVTVNLRGGNEYGEAWHEAGMKLKKQNVFDDFIAAAEYLEHEKYTSPDKLVISGGSNGGLLVGAVMTQRPELYRVVVCSVPLLDMVRYHLFGEGKTWIGEYGSAEKADEFAALHAYSPYHHVKKGTRYPSLLLMSADSDDRVDPMHARKFAAAVQAATTGGPVLLRIEQHAGHGGADMIKAWVKRQADEFAFLFAELGIKP